MHDQLSLRFAALFLLLSLASCSGDKSPEPCPDVPPCITGSTWSPVTCACVLDDELGDAAHGGKAEAGDAADSDSADSNAIDSKEAETGNAPDGGQADGAVEPVDAQEEAEASVEARDASDEARD